MKNFEVKKTNKKSSKASLKEGSKQQFLTTQLRENRKRGLKILDELDALKKEKSHG